MIEQLLLFFLKDALFLLGVLARGSAFPKPLSREEETALIERMAAGDGEAREKLIEHNLRLAAHIARKYTVPGFDADDLVSIGTVGLIYMTAFHFPNSQLCFAEHATRAFTVWETAFNKACFCPVGQIRWRERLDKSAPPLNTL